MSRSARCAARPLRSQSQVLCWDRHSSLARRTVKSLTVSLSSQTYPAYLDESTNLDGLDLDVHPGTASPRLREPRVSIPPLPHRGTRSRTEKIRTTVLR
jgi:hypothetical protein